jgi:hypothetical protein
MGAEKKIGLGKILSLAKRGYMMQRERIYFLIAINLLVHPQKPK